jgi:hypothetical protein
MRKIDPEKTVLKTITNGDEWIETGKLKMNSRGYDRGSTFREQTSRRRSRHSQAVSVTACTWH